MLSWNVTVCAGGGAARVDDLVSLVRHAVQLDDELVPYPERVQRRYADWLAAQQSEGGLSHPNNAGGWIKWRRTSESIWKSMLRISITASSSIAATGCGVTHVWSAVEELLDELNQALTQ